MITRIVNISCFKEGTCLIQLVYVRSISHGVLTYCIYSLLGVYFVKKLFHSFHGYFLALLTCVHIVMCDTVLR